MPLSINNGNKMTITLLIACFFAIAPILDPYVLVQVSDGITIRINDIFVVGFGLLCFLKRPVINLRYSFLMFWVLGLAMISIIANLINNTDGISSFKNLLVWFVYAVLLMIIWAEPSREEFLKIVDQLLVL